MREINSPAEFAELMKECVAQVKYYVDKIKDKTGIVIPYPKVTFALKGTTAGVAYCGRNLISFSPTLLRENADTFLQQATGHEVAHLATYAKYGRVRPHGDEWGRIMWCLGLPASRCHNYDTSNVPALVGRVKRPSSQPPQIIKVNHMQIRPTGIGNVVEFD